MTLASTFSPDAATARGRFLDAVAGRADVENCPLPESDFVVDVARFGPANADRMLVLSGGLHGLEAPFGAAVILAALTEIRWPSDLAVVLIPTLNPWGFTHRRRTDRDNIDLNRNFLIDRPYQGSPPGYARLDRLLNPRHPPATDGFLIRLWWSRLTMGEAALRQAVAAGQYEYPGGLFFGGTGPSGLMKLLTERWPVWIRPASAVLHLDFHTGLGPSGIGKLLVSESPDHALTTGLTANFGPDLVESAGAGTTAYRTHGSIDDWAMANGGGRRVMSACAEFGTFGPLKVLGSLRAENQAHHFAEAESPPWIAAKRNAAEAFVPSDLSWRNRAIGNALDLVRRAVAFSVS